MDRALHDQILQTFFHCDPQAITGIFREFLNALIAEDTLPPVAQMEQNYETARANPEIHMLPGNLKDARDFQQRIVDFLDAGVPLVLVLYPDSGTAIVHRPDGASQLLRGPEAALDGEQVLPGLVLPLGDVFR